jgi:hypothetical protein
VSLPRSGGHCAAAIAAAALAAAASPVSSTPTTLCPGPRRPHRAVRPWSRYAAFTTGCCEGGWTLERRPGGGLRFRRPNGAALPPLPAQPPGERPEPVRRNGRAGLRLDDLTGAPRVSFDRLDLPLVVEGLAERDPRLRE